MECIFVITKAVCCPKMQDAIVRKKEPHTLQCQSLRTEVFRSQANPRVFSIGS